MLQEPRSSLVDISFITHACLALSMRSACVWISVQLLKIWDDFVTTRADKPHPWKLKYQKPEFGVSYTIYKKFNI